MGRTNRLSGWKLLIYVIFLGPFFLFLYLREYKTSYPFTKYSALVPPALLFICSYLCLTLSYSPNWIRLIYAFLLFSVFIISYIICWIIDSKSKVTEPSSRENISFSRAIAWMFFMGTLFYCLSIVSSSINYWLFGEYIAVYFSSDADIFNIWIVIGLIYGFTYGMHEKNRYFNQDIRSLLKSTLLVFLFIAILNLMILLLVVYPLQRLVPISYMPQTSDISFYVLGGLAIPLSIIYFMHRIPMRGLKKTLGLMVVAIPLILLHSITLSVYAIPINLTIASILEDNEKRVSANELYSKTIPFIRHEPLLASLYHRQGVLNVLNQNYEGAISFFKSVMTDYSEQYDVYEKARMYVESYERNHSLTGKGRKILTVQHRTFEQAASCFPNSLSLILNFYEKDSISTRGLSYSIKEGFDEGTFIWKVHAFLKNKDYSLITTFWQTKDTLISLLEAGYPILIYIPGHVYTLYGYDSHMEMFFSYNTAKLNRWDDTPFEEFQKAWMSDSFLMSVVVRKEDEKKLRGLAPQLFYYSDIYQSFQKCEISHYYESKSNYWKDYDQNKLLASIGIEALKLNNPFLHNNGFDLFPWDQKKWREEILPILNQPWAMEWDVFERFTLYLLYHGKVDRAQNLIHQYQSHINRESYPVFNRLLELNLATEAAAENEKEVLSISDKLIGKMSGHEYGSYWGYYFRAKNLMDQGELKQASRLLFPVMNNFSLESYYSQNEFRCIMEILNEIQKQDPSLIEREHTGLMEIIRIHYGMTN